MSTPFSCLLLNPSCRSFISQFCLKVKPVRASRDSGRLVTLAAPFLFIAAYVVSLFFLGFNIEVFSLSLIWPVAAVFWVLASRYESGLAVPGTGLAMSMLLYWGWQAVTLLWSPVPFVSTTMFWWLSALPLAFWLYLLLPRERHWPRYAIPILLSGLGLAFTGAYQLLIAGKTPDSLFLDVNTHAALLNLIALPACGYLLVLLSGSRAGNRSAMLMGLSFFILTYGILLTRSRGGTLSFLVCTGILLAMALRHVPRRIVVIPAGLIALAYLLADLSWAGGLTERAGTLSDIREAGAGRFVIWSQSWLMLFEHSPFRGIGLGIYSILWPPYRVPQDDSAGFFVHNDYLQIWIEAGLPGLLLFLALLGGALWTTVRILGNAHLPARGPAGDSRPRHGAGRDRPAQSGPIQFLYRFYSVPVRARAGEVAGTGDGVCGQQAEGMAGPAGEVLQRPRLSGDRIAGGAPAAGLSRLHRHIGIPAFARCGARTDRRSRARVDRGTPFLARYRCAAVHACRSLSFGAGAVGRRGERC